MQTDRKKLLICDDSLLIRTQLREFLSDCQYEFDILEASDGEQAVNLYMQERPDLVFLDVVMPKMDGIVCLQRICQFDKDAKVVMLTSVGTKEIVKEALRAGAIDFMQKPWNKDVLVQMLESFFASEGETND